MSAPRQSLSCALAGSILVVAASCREVTEPEATSITATESPALARSAPKKPPTGPLNLRSTGNTSWSVSFAWDEAAGAVSYRLRDNWGREITVPGTQTSVTWKYPAHPPLQNGATYSFSVYAVDAAGNKSAGSNTVTVSLPLDHTPPTVPTFTVTSVGTRHIGLAWSSTDDAPFISYIVTKDGVKISSGGFTWISETSRTFTLLQPGTTYTFTAQAKDRFVNESGGNLSAVSPPFSVATKVNDGSDVTPPTQPSNVQAFSYGDLEMQVWWTASTDAVTPQNVIVYEIYVNGVHENTAIGKNMTPSAYGVFGDNEITVIAIDEAGNRSPAGQTTIFIQ
jgi:fibronectin type III domain protein